MIRLRFVWDGPLDINVLPALASVVIGTPVEGEMEPWPRLHGKGLGQKLRFAARQAAETGADGLVAVVDGDADGCGEKLRALRGARQTLREERPPYPVGLGCAVPHAEAWLIDDGVAVREGLRLPGTAAIPNVRHCESPKNELRRLHGESERHGDNHSEVWGDIARRVVEQRCAHAHETGFHSFAEDLRDELRGFRQASE